MDVCALCQGRSWTTEVVDDEVVPIRCACFEKRLAMAFLGPELWKTPHQRSDLYRVERDPVTNEKMGDRTLDDLFIKGAWAEVAKHLRWALGAKRYADERFNFKMVTDDRLLRVWLGDFRYSNRSKQIRDDVETYNNLTDLVGGVSLVIIRLGYLSYGNRAAASVLYDALRVRAVEGRPTWLVEGKTPFGPGHKFYNDEVGQYIEDNFETINVGGDIEAERQAAAQMSALSADTVSLDTEASEPLQQALPKERYHARPGDWGHKKKKQSGWQKRKRGALEGIDV